MTSTGLLVDHPFGSLPDDNRNSSPDKDNTRLLQVSFIVRTSKIL